jgi:hypothetical protein
MYVSVLPDEIRFSQDNINNTFAFFKGQLIGEVLDEICDKKITVDDFLRNMKIGHWNNQNDKWYTINNRSLWVLKQLRLNGVIPGNQKITFEVQDIEPFRFTTKNEGTSIVVRRKPVGGEHAKRNPFWRYRKETWDGQPANTVEIRNGRPLMKGGSASFQACSTGAGMESSSGSQLVDYESDYDSDDCYE